jgi:hypothetical protein
MVVPLFWTLLQFSMLLRVYVTEAMEWQKSVKVNSTVSTTLYFAWRYLLKIERSYMTGF